VPDETNFSRAMDFVLRWEGGYVNDENDAGGETHWGISKRAFPDLDIRALSEDKARAIYRTDYWDKISGDDLPAPVSLVVMDYAVNSGVSRAAKALQRIVGVTRDGQIGPQTLEAIQGFDLNFTSLAESVVLRRVRFLCKLVKRKPSQAKFLNGWMRRTHDCMAAIYK